MATLFNNLTNSLTNIRSAETETRSTRSQDLRLVLRLPRGWPETGKLDWCQYEGSSVTAHGSIDQLSDLPADVRNVPAHVWSPAEETLLTRISIPTRSRSMIAKALPYALEEKLIDDPSEQFFTFERSADNLLTVSVTRRDKLTQWLAAFDEAGVMVQSITPITLSLSTLASAWLLHCERDVCWVRSGVRSGFRCEIDADSPPSILISSLKESVTKPDTLIVHNPPASFNLDIWKQALGLEVLVEDTGFWEAAETNKLPINLLQQEFAPRTRVTGLSQMFRPAFYLTVAWLIGTIFFTSLEWWRLNDQFTGLRSEMTAIFKERFPQEAGLIVDPYKQMQANLAQKPLAGSNSSDTDFLSLLGDISPVLSRFTGIVTKEIAYQPRALTVTLELPDYRTLETVKNTIAEQGVGFSVGQVRQKEGKVVASIILEKK